MKTIIIIGLCLIYGAGMHAQTESLWGAKREEIVQRYSSRITEVDPYTNGITLRMEFYEHDAEVYLGFPSDEKVGYINVSFTEYKQALTLKDRLSLFRDVRNRLERIKGSQDSYVRIDGVEVLGESHRSNYGKRYSNVIMFRTVENGVLYEVELLGESLDDLANDGDVILTISLLIQLTAPM